ncbi:hypothetical protein [Methylobacterium nonmethylotrophicum]|uniref:Uncharacterized protein n=1 Tax=Methylobacterium nonmethylotrophicum TaxID=1141884 RepID=A0A4Z0NT25_9HYPH|nr:hypothetical protein [Methylobacterium nonmethylotrophicum]TGD99799.1 hypothetical protein EU555_11590 [Methylobacterium nonmethylotrophicum]
MTTRRGILLAACMAWTGPALAADGTVSLTGRAVVGPESRDVAMAFTCTDTRSRTETGSLSIGFEVPNFEALEKRFDFGAFEGPSGTRRPLTEITVGQPVRVSANGAIKVDGTTFALGAGASLRGEAAELAKLRSVVAAAGAGPGSLRWRQESPRKGDSPLVVTVSISAAESDRLKTALAPCLKVDGKAKPKG